MSADLVSQSDLLVKQLNGLRETLQSHHDNLRQLTSQKSENESVKVEFSKLESEAEIWKLTGPLLVKQDKNDASANVDKRLEFIDIELKKVEEVVKRIETEFEEKRQELVKVQSELQQAGVAVK